VEELMVMQRQEHARLGQNLGAECAFGVIRFVEFLYVHQKNSSVNNIKHFLLQISPIVQFLYLAGRSEAKKKSDLLKGTLRSKFTSVNATEAHTLLCFVVTISYHTFIFYFFPWRWDRFESQLSVRTKSTFGHDAHE
jgi:hypothetical protein